jgi:hypothetical protein
MIETVISCEGEGTKNDLEMKCKWFLEKKQNRRGKKRTGEGDKEREREMEIDEKQFSSPVAAAGIPVSGVLLSPKFPSFPLESFSIHWYPVFQY